MEGVKNLVQSLNILVTYRCNSRCRICDIWKAKYEKIDMDDYIIKSLFESDVLKNSKKYYGDDFDITFTGGEPFMREDFPSLFSLFQKKFPRSKFTISTNGLSTSAILRFFKEIGNKEKLSLHISLDGIKSHDLQRGVIGAYEKTMHTIKKMREIFPEVKIKLKFTISPFNYNEVSNVFLFAKKNNLEIGIKPIEYLKCYTNPFGYFDDNFVFDDKKIKVLKKQLKEIAIYYEKNKSGVEYLFISDIIRVLNGNKISIGSCSTPRYSVFITPNGDVFNCLHFDCVGNLYKNNFDSIWNSEKAIKNVKLAGEMKCKGCLSFHGSYKNYLKLLTFPAT